MTKTPQFDKTLDEILKDLKPYDRTCKQCGQSFHIFQEDIDFYHMLRVPPPTLCPLCRKKRRFGHLMRVPKFFKKRCSAPGHEEEVITVYPPASPHKIYDFSYWHSDAWDAADFGRNYDLSKPFFGQFKELFFDSPHVSLERDPQAVNSDYLLGGSGGSKNVYYGGMAFETEDAAYSFDLRYCRWVFDCNFMTHSEFCFGSISSLNCNRCLFVIESEGCLDSSFLYDCRNCSHCFLSSNLRNKSYVFNNQQLTEEEYKGLINKINLGNRDVLESYLKKFKREILVRALHRAFRTIHVQDSIGDSIKECRASYYAFRGEKGDNIRYVDNFIEARDSMDCLNLVGESSYEIGACLRGSNNKFSVYIRNSSFLEYCSECYDCHYCFGCIGLKNKKFHIFNRSCSDSEYWQIIDQIKLKMFAEGEYGEFFPLHLGLVPYQSSLAQAYFPLTENEAVKMDIPWYVEAESNIPKDIPLLNAPEEVPVDIKEVSDDILEKAIICEISKKPFRIIRMELEFYRKMNLPLPTKHPWQRIQKRFKSERQPWLYPFKCPKCGEQTHTVYSPEQQKELKIYCEKCYLQEVV